MKEINWIKKNSVAKMGKNGDRTTVIQGTTIINGVEYLLDVIPFTNKKLWLAVEMKTDSPTLQKIYDSEKEEFVDYFDLSPDVKNTIEHFKNNNIKEKE